MVQKKKQYKVLQKNILGCWNFVADGPFETLEEAIQEVKEWINSGYYAVQFKIVKEISVSIISTVKIGEDD